MTLGVAASQSQTIQDEILELEKRLDDAKGRLTSVGCEHLNVLRIERPVHKTSIGHSTHHFLLLLADSALPLGSFAFSSGLESYVAHTRPSTSFTNFLHLSLCSYASTTLPFVLAAHRTPPDLLALDDHLDAAIMCTVGRRASVAQGRALISIWDRSFSSAIPPGCSLPALEVLKAFVSVLRSASVAPLTSGGDQLTASAHLGPLFGVVASVLGLSLEQTAYVFMLNHVKALLSAAVRASIFGPYQAQKLLASAQVQSSIEQAIEHVWDMKVEDAGQSIPMMDLWVGRHELLYSRIFNS